MKISEKLDQLHFKVRQNKWLYYFAIFNRVVLAAGFIPSGMQKVLGERFTVLSVNHPMGNYLEAFYHTGYYYTFVGVLQVLAAILLLIPPTATIGALIYFPIILNICILSLAVCFDGSMVSSPLMLLACLYLLCWDYHKLKLILPFYSSENQLKLPSPEMMTFKFPFKFMVIVVTLVGIVLLNALYGYTIKPYNSYKECQNNCINHQYSKECNTFCDCIHLDGKSYQNCLKEYKESIE